MKKIFTVLTVLPANEVSPNGLPFEGSVPSVSAAWNAIRKLREWDQVPTEKLVGTRVTVAEAGQPPVIDIIFTMSTKGKILFTDYNKYLARRKQREAKAKTEAVEEN
jgi:hypothetical protein